VVGIHQIFEVRQRKDGKAERQRDQNDHGETTNDGPVPPWDAWILFSQIFCFHP
jgi:hypothetical protein